MKGNWKRRGLAWLLTMAMLMTTVGNNWLLGSAAENEDTASAVQTDESGTEAVADDAADGAGESTAAEETSGGEVSLMDVFTYGEEELTWAQAGRILAGLLGFIEEDGADVDLTAYADRVSSLSLDDDSFYLAILADNGYLDGVSEVIDPSAAISEETYETLLTEAFTAEVFTQEDAEALVTQEEPDNLAISGEEIFLNAYEAGRIVLGENDSLELSSVTAQVISVTDVDSELDLDATEIERVLVNGGTEDAAADTEDTVADGTAVGTGDAAEADANSAADDVAGTEDDTADGENAENADDAEDSARLYIHMDSESGLPEVILEQADDVVIEGSGSLGVVRVTGEVGSLTVRATGSVINETDADFTVTGPDHEEVTLAPGEQVEFVLTGYLVSFRTEGTPVESQTVTPGSMVDFTSAQTELDGMVFTAWYADEEYTEPYSRLTAVDEETTLYARFIDEADALTVTFETFGGRELEPLVFAKGETLLTKDITGLYTSKEGYTFSGWCVDEDCTTAFGYSQAIEESMTLYALLVSNEAQEVVQEGTVAELVDLDWQEGIGLVLPDGMTILEAAGSVSIEAGIGGEEPAVSFRETDNGTELYGTYYEEGGESGFEPGATFTVTVSDGICFEGYEDYIDTLTVSVYKEEIEYIEYAEDLTWVLWEHVSDLVPAMGDESTYEVQVTDDGTVDEESVETPITPGTLVLDDSIAVEVGDIVIFYDGSIDDDEDSVLYWEGGSLDGYALYAEITAVETTDDGTLLTFVNADPSDYITDMDIHITKEVNLEGSLDESEIAQIEDAIATQVMNNEELSAQMMIAVMNSQEAQDLVDEYYGEGVYSLALGDMGGVWYIDYPEVTLWVEDNVVTASVSVTGVVKIGTMDNTVMELQATLAFIEEVAVTTSINGKFLWVDMSMGLESKSTFRFDIRAVSGGSDALDEARDALDEVIDPEGIDDSMDYDTTVSELMDTMQDLVSSNLDYSELYSQNLCSLEIKYKNIVRLKTGLTLNAEMGVMAVFGVDIVVTSGVSFGFKYNFLKFSGSSHSEKLPTKVTSNIYTIGKMGLRLGLELSLEIELLSKVDVKISGIVYIYAEMTGLYYYTFSLQNDDETSIGALHFEVGLGVDIPLKLKVDCGLFTISKDWMLWQARWAFYTYDMAASLTYMDVERLDELWESATENSDKRSSYGFAAVPMKTYDLTYGSLVENELLWESTDLVSLEVVAVTVNGEEITEADERWEIFYVGDEADGESHGRIYANEELAVEQEITEASCEIAIVYEDTSRSALVKRQEHIFQLSRKFEIATTTVNVSVVLYDWCSHEWGIESAAWDGTTVYTETFVEAHILGKGADSTATGEINLAAVEAAVRSEYSDLASGTLAWYDPTRNSLYGAVEYSVPKTSSFCYLTPSTGTVRYDVRPGTDEYSLTFYLYARRFEGYEDSITYIVRLIGADDSSYAFRVNTGTRDLQFSPSGTEGTEWTLSTKRALFNGTARPLLMSVDGGSATDTGYSITGREVPDTVIFEIDLNQMEYGLTIVMGEGVTGYTATAAASDTQMSAAANNQTTSTDNQTDNQEVASEAGQTMQVKFGEEVNLDVELADDYTNLELAFEPTGTEYTLTEEGAVFAMPRYDLTATLRAYENSTLTYDYNYGNLGVYTSQTVAANETTAAPEDPTVEGMTFRGWYLTADCTGEPYEFGSAPKGDVTLYADWTCDVTVVFGDAAGIAAYVNENGESISFFENDTTEYHYFTYSTQRVGENLPDIVLPDYSGYDFMGWHLTGDYSDEALALDTYTLSGGVTIYARWVAFVSVAYAWNDGTDEMYSGAAEHFGLALEYIPADPEREHYTFTGWYSTEACLKEELVDLTAYLPEYDVTFYAGWSANDYTITYDLQGGENDAANPALYTIESKAITLKEPTRTGYTFTGWTGTGLAEAMATVTIPTGTTGNLSYTATWEPITYTITYNLVRGTLTGEIPATYTIESDDIVLAVPEKEGYEFEGWIGTDLTEATLTVTIPAGSIGDRSYKATWSTDNPSFTIADNAIEAVEGDYTFALDDYLEGTDEDSSIYQAAWEALVNDPEAGLYEDDITLALELAEGIDNPAEDETCYTWTFTATIVYTDDDGNEVEREGTVRAIVNKRVPTVIAPTASDLEYGNTLTSSNLSGGSAEYEESSVDGAFTWTDDTIVPKAADNGSEIYSVTFTPTDTAHYAVVTVDVAVATQTGVEVYIGSVDSRYYIPGITQTTGTYMLIDADTQEEISDPEMTLTGDIYNFSKEDVGNWIVTLSGYSNASTATLPGGVIAKYVLMSDDPVSETFDTSTGTTSDARAIITTRIPFGETEFTNLAITTQPTLAEGTTLTYGDYLYSTMLSEGEVTCTYNYPYYSGTVTVDGTWKWGAYKVNAAGLQSYTVTFTPTYSLGYKGESTTLEVNVAKATVDAPSFESTSLVYNGKYQFPNYSTSTLYSTGTITAGRYVGDYTITFTLKNPDNYTWSEDARKAGTIDPDNEAALIMTYSIVKGELSVDTSSAAVTSIAYGQRLSAETGTDTGMANGMISNVRVYNTVQTVAGTWAWDLSSLTTAQPLSVNSGGYKVKAIFTPTDEEIAASVNYPSVEFTVMVEQVTPDLTNATVTPSEIFQWGWTTLASSTVTSTGVVNPNDSSMTVDGTWSWEEPTLIPESGETYKAVFTPKNTTNYGTVTAVVEVPMTTQLSVFVYRDGGTLSLGSVTADDFTTSDNVEYITDVKKNSSVLYILHSINDYSISSVALTSDGTSLGTETLGTTIKYPGKGKTIDAQSIFGDKVSIAVTYSYEETISGTKYKLIRIQLIFDWSKIKPTGSISVNLLSPSSNGLSLSLSSASSGLALSTIADTAAQSTDDAKADETEGGTVQSADMIETGEVSADTGRGQNSGTAQTGETTAGADSSQSSGSVVDTGTGGNGGAATDSDTGGSGETQSTEAQTETATQAQKSTDAQTEAATEKQTEAATEAQKSTEAQTEAATEVQKSTETQTEAATETATETP